MIKKFVVPGKSPSSSRGGIKVTFPEGVPKDMGRLRRRSTSSSKEERSKMSRLGGSYKPRGHDQDQRYFTPIKPKPLERTRNLKTEKEWHGIY